MVQLNLEISTPNEYYLTGDIIPYTLKYANPSTTEDALDLIITDVLDPLLEYVSHVNSPDVETVETSTTNNQTTVRFVMKSPLAAGSTGIIQLNARFKSGETPSYLFDSTSFAINAIRATGRNVIESSSNELTLYPITLTPNWSVTKQKLLPATDPTTESEVTYQINVSGNANQVGALNLTAITITDSLPPEATFISATPQANYENHTLTWTHELLTPGKRFSPTVTLSYEGSSLTETDTVTNEVLVTATSVGHDPLQKTASFTHGFAPITPAIDAISKYTRTSNDLYSVGQLAIFYIHNLLNNGNTALNEVTYVDVLPPYVHLEQLKLATFTSNQFELSLTYKTNLSDTLTAWPIVGDQTLFDVSDLTLASGEHITEVHYSLLAFDEFPIGFSQTSPIELHTRILTPPSLPFALTNNVSVQATKSGYTPITKTAQTTITIITPVPWIQAVKRVKNNQNNVNPGEQIEYELIIRAHRFTTGEFNDPQFIDVLPSELQNIEILSVDLSRAPLVDESVEIILDQTVTLNDEEHQSIQGKIFGTLNANDRVTITYRADVSDSAQNGYITNTLYVGTQNASQAYQNSNIQNITFTGIETTRWIRDHFNTYINFVGSLSSVKWLKGELDDTYSKYPEFGKTLPGGKTDYRLIVSNELANGPISNIVLIDVFPRLNDEGVLDKNPRESLWQPYLINVITGIDQTPLPDSATIYYTTRDELSFTELENPFNEPVESDGWQLIPPQDITTIKAVKITFGDFSLAQGESLTVEWQMRAPVNAVVNEIAWNSFGYTATYPSSNGPIAFLASEPIKVGFIVEPYPVNTSIISQFVWTDDRPDGLISENEVGINGIKIELFSTTEQALLGYTRTGFNILQESGYAQFPNITPGNYYLQYTYPRYYELSPTFVGDDPEINSWVNASSNVISSDLTYASYTVKTPTFTVGENEVFHRNLGLFERVNMSGLVFLDRLNSQTVLNNPPLESVTVSLLDEFKQPILIDGIAQTVLTDQFGHFSFASLRPGRYLIAITNPRVDAYNFVTPFIGDDATIYSVVNATGESQVLTLLSGETRAHQNAGLVEVFGEISGLIWNDLNRDGLINEDELKMFNVSISLINDQSETLTTKISSIDGHYSFEQLQLGRYKINVTPLLDYTFTTYESGNDETINSKIFPRTGESATLELTKLNPVQSFIHAGLYFNETITLDGYVFVNPIRFTDELTRIKLQSNVRVTLYDSEGIVATTTTDATGHYAFHALTPKPYRIVYQINNENPIVTSYCFAPTD